MAFSHAPEACQVIGRPENVGYPSDDCVVLWVRSPGWKFLSRSCLYRSKSLGFSSFRIHIDVFVQRFLYIGMFVGRGGVLQMSES